MRSLLASATAVATKTLVVKPKSRTATILPRGSLSLNQILPCGDSINGSKFSPGGVEDGPKTPGSACW